MRTKEVGSLRMGNGKRESNGCTVHFNSILQLLIYKPQRINKTLIKLEISKEASFFFLIVLYFLFSFTFEHYTFFFLLYSLNYYLITPPYHFTLEVSSIFLYLVVLKENKWDRKWVKLKQQVHLSQVKYFRRHTIHSTTLKNRTGAYYY